MPNILIKYAVLHAGTESDIPKLKYLKQTSNIVNATMIVKLYEQEMETFEIKFSIKFKCTQIPGKY